MDHFLDQFSAFSEENVSTRSSIFLQNALSNSVFSFTFICKFICKMLTTFGIIYATDSLLQDSLTTLR